MNTTVSAANSFEGGWVGRPMGGCSSFELAKAFGGRIYSIAKHITQNDDAAEYVLIETFLKACSVLDGCPESKVWFRLVAIAVGEAFSKLDHRGEGRGFSDRATDSYEDLVVRECAVWGTWGESEKQSSSRERTTRVLERGLRSLDPMCRTVFVLRDMEEIPVAHIAEIVNRSKPAVEVCLLRARLQLREMLNVQ